MGLTDCALLIIGTGGHVDEFARFVGPSTVLLAEVSDRQRASSQLANITWARLEADAKLLAEQADQDGRPLKVIRLPLPDELTVTADPSDGIYQLLQQLPELHLKGATSPIEVVLAASYSNYVVRIMRPYLRIGSRTLSEGLSVLCICLGIVCRLQMVWSLFQNTINKGVTRSLRRQTPQLSV